jgi:predicted transcriptional regulator
MTVKKEIQAYLSREGRSSVSEIAEGTGYSPGYVRQNSKQMKSDGVIQGTKVPKRVPAAIINGEMEVLSDSKDQLLSIIKVHAPHLESKAKKMSVDGLQDLIADKIADRTLAFEQEVWEFW